MDTLHTTIAEKNPKRALILLHAGFIITPDVVATLLETTNASNQERIQRCRRELAEIVSALRTRQPIAFEKLVSLPMNHAESPLGALGAMEAKFKELLEV